MKTVYVYKTDEHYDAILPVVPSVMYNGGGQRSSMVTNTNSFQVKCPYDLCDGKNHAVCACVSAGGKMQMLFDEYPCVGKQSRDDIVGVTADNLYNDEGYMRHIGCDTLRSDERRDMRYSYSGDGKKNSDNNFTDIKICAWNIEGLTADTLTDDILGKFFFGFHIL